MTLIGATAIEDKLQEVNDLIYSLWLVTNLWYNNHIW